MSTKVAVQFTMFHNNNDHHDDLGVLLRSFVPLTYSELADTIWWTSQGVHHLYGEDLFIVWEWNQGLCLVEIKNLTLEEYKEIKAKQNEDEVVICD